VAILVYDNHTAGLRCMAGVWGTVDGADGTSFVAAHMLGGESSGDSGNRNNLLPPVTGTCMTSSGSTPCERGRMGSGVSRGP